MILISNQMALAWVIEQRGKSYNHRTVTVEPYGFDFWSCFRGSIEEDGSIYLQSRVANSELVDYKSFVNKVEAKKSIEKLDNPVVCIVGEKFNLVSFICEDNKKDYYINNTLEILNNIDTKDVQQKKLYQWEEVFIDSFDQPINIKKMHALCDNICEKEELDRVLCINGDTKSKVFMGKACILRENALIPSETVIFMSHNTKITLIHELAHALVEKKYGVFAGQAHGGIFVFEYIQLLVKYAGLNAEYLLKSAKDFGLKVASDSERREALARREEW